MVLDGDPASRDQGPGGRFSTEAVLLALQAPTTGAPRSSLLSTTTDPLLPPRTVEERLAHFPPDLYDTRPESHLTRLMKALLGDAGAGGMRKHYVAARLQSVLATMRYADMDALFGSLFGLRRLSNETLPINPYLDSATPEEWAQIDSRDASYRSRLEAFARSIALAATPEGLAASADAMLGTECRVYESWMLVDETGSNPGGAPPTPGARLYSDVEEDFATYSEMDRGTYADIEGGTGGFGRTTSTNRGEVIIRPTRQVTLEELRQLTVVLSRLKPSGALLTIDPLGVAIHVPVAIRDVAASSEDWEVSAKVAAGRSVAAYYARPSPVPVAQPRPASAGYLGEVWSYNADVAAATSYAESPTGARVQDVDYERVIDAAGRPVDLTPARGLADPAGILLGRSASDGIMAVAAFSAERGRPRR